MIAGLAGLPEDTTRVQALNDLVGAAAITNPTVSNRYSHIALALALKLGWVRGQARALNNFGNISYYASEYAEALRYYREALRHYETINDSQGIGTEFGNFSTIYLTTQETEKAYQYAQKALAMKEALRIDKKVKYRRLVDGYIDIGRAALAIGKRKQALDYLLKAKEVAQLVSDHGYLLYALYYLGEYFTIIKDFPTALSYYAGVLRIVEAENRFERELDVVGKIGNTYLEIAKLPTLPKADSLVAYSRPANLDKALTYFRRSVTTTHKWKISVLDRRDLMAGYAEALALHGDYKQAAQAYRNAAALTDTVAKSANSERIVRMESKQALALKEKDIKIAALDLSKKKNQSWMLLGGVGVLALVLGLVYRGLRQQKHSNTLLSVEKKRSDDLLLNILPAEIAEELKEKGKTEARHFDQVSILFTDFVNFTETAERLSPTELVAELHTCFSAFDRIMKRHGLEKIKTIGDAYMAAAGLPVPDAAHAQKCVRAALDVRDFIEERHRQGGPFEIRIGINSGPVVAGIVGIDKFAYDIWGDTVNTAARMEQHGKAGQVNISQSTYALIRSDFECLERGKITAKHKGEIEMYFVTQKLASLDYQD